MSKIIINNLVKILCGVLGCGCGVLLWWFSSGNKTIIDKIILYVCAIIFGLVGIILIIQGFAGIINKRISENDSITVNMSIEAGLISFVLFIMFFAVDIFFMIPRLDSEDGDSVGVWIFGSFALFCLVYSLSIFIYRIFKKINH